MDIAYSPKVSVIVAIYNVEQYIKRCAISLFNQTLDDIEYIFIDDCSSDNSLNILESVIKQFPKRADNIKIIRNSKNFQVAYTRTIGMKAATGTYVIHCDPDDYVDLDYFETIYNAAINSRADIVATNYYRETNDLVSVIKGDYYSNIPRDCITNIHRSYFFPSFCTHLIKRSLYVENDIYPIGGINSGEDLNVLLRIFYYAEKLLYLDKAFYHYVLRDTSITQNKDISSLWRNNISKNLEYLIFFFESKGDGNYSTMLNYLKFTKKQILLSANPPQTRLWYNLYPECRKDILHFTSLPISRRLLYLIFSYSYPLMNLYFKIRY